jgi:hypothetical protein
VADWLSRWGSGVNFLGKSGGCGKIQILNFEFIFIPFIFILTPLSSFFSFFFILPCFFPSFFLSLLSSPFFSRLFLLLLLSSFGSIRE